MMYESIYQAMRDGAAVAMIPRWTVDILGDIVTGRHAVAAVRHPLGFVCLPVERQGTAGVCVHVWSQRLAPAHPTTSTAHAHSWDLISYILYGALRNDLVGVTDAPTRPTHRIFEVTSRGHTDDIRPTGRLVRQELETSEIHRPGEIYSLPAGVFHDTATLGEVATVALGRGRHGAVDLVLGSVHVDHHRVHRQLCDREETVYAATIVAEALTPTANEGLRREYRCQRKS